MLSSKQKVILIVLVGIIGIVVGYLFLAEKEDAIQVDYPDNLSQDSVNNTDHSEDYQSFILKQMSGSGINETKNAFEISLPSEYNAILNVDGVLITVTQDDFKLLIGTQLDSTGGTYTTLPEYEPLETDITQDDIWRIKTIEGYYYTSFFE
ncbi:hypothetical protein KC909_06930, partial [Candidatus Dojkabacteria bacterium]|nr:hypothetical protein [Candidatus Dojkabacteria bacterium]